MTCSWAARTTEVATCSETSRMRLGCGTTLSTWLGLGVGFELGYDALHLVRGWVLREDLYAAARALQADPQGQ